ncbi:hypothetical protein ACQ4PT_052815 [Festuca glaucescens]
MEAALGSATSLLGKVLTTLYDGLVAAYVDSLELGRNSDQIKAKLLHTLGLLQNAQGSDVGHNRGLQGLLENLSRMANQAEDLLDEVHYFQIHDKLHGTHYATTQEAGPDMRGTVRHQALHVRSALHHTVGSLLECFSCSRTHDDGDYSAVTGDPRSVTNSASADGDTLHFDRVSVSRKIKSVLQDMQYHCDSVSDLLGNIPSNSRPVVRHRLQVGSIIIQDTLYGRKNTFEQTVNRIMSCKQTVSVLPIVGPGGIGKTTFTQHLYNDARTKKHFQVRVWVCVSTDFDVFKLTREIHGCIPVTEEGTSGAANETTNLDQLQKSIVDRLEFKRFLIILDDIWKCDSVDQWKTLLAPFTKGKTQGSMVLVTTRFPKLAQMMKTTESLELPGLESNDFFAFFEACIFGDHKPEHYEDELVGIAGKIANKLKGSPLAAKTVARLLQKDLSQEHWNGVLQRHEWLNLENNDDIMPSLKISYDYLHFDLKKLFSYFGLFPEDYQFYNSEMNRLFLAIGIADSTHQVGRNYLEELVDYGFLMKGGDDGHEYYVLHDLMHQLCQSVSTQECLNISGLDFRADAIPQSVRHLSITIENRYDENFEEEMCKLRGRIDIANLRTLMIFRGYEERIAKLLKDSFKEINSLRVLFIEVNSPESFPNGFSKLIHLQYLKIGSAYNCRISLPSTLARFYHLKFLDLDDWLGSSDLPEYFSHLENLHDFRAKDELHSNIRNVGKIKHLRRLKEFHVKKESIGFELREVGALTELEELVVCDLEHVATKEEARAAKLMLKKDLKELKLLWGKDRPTIDVDILDALQPHPNLRVLTIANYGGTICPSWLCLGIWLTNLETLTLDSVSWGTLPPLGKLPNLKVLILKKISGMRQFGPQYGGAPGKCFMRLKTVRFQKMPELTEWVVEPNCHSFRSLKTIECIDCPNLRVMPFSELSCTNLCKLIVSECPKISLPSMPHTHTLTDLVVKGAADLATLSYDGNKLVVNGYGGALAFHNMDKVKDLSIGDVSHISLTDIKKFKNLRELSFSSCNSLVLVPVENGVQEDNPSLISLIINRCGKLFSQWPVGEGAGGVQTIYPFPASVRKLYVEEEASMNFMLLSNLTSLTSLSLVDCSNLTVDGFNPLIVVNLKELAVYNLFTNNTLAADLLLEVAKTKLLPAGSFRLEKLTVDNISRLLVAPICNLLAPALRTLSFTYDIQAESFTEEQEKALQLLTSLQNLEFFFCDNLQSLPQGLHRLSSLMELRVLCCPEIQWMEIEKIKRTNPDLTILYC